MEDVIRINQERAVVRIFARIGAERLIFGGEHLHPAVGHRAHCGDAVVAVRDRAGRAAAAADIRGARAEDGAVGPLCAPGAEFHDGPPRSRAHDAVGLRGDEAFVVNRQKEHRLDKLRLHDGAAHGQNRLAGENRHAFRHGPDIARKAECREILQKFLIKEAAAAQVVDVLLRKVQIFQVLDHLLHAGHDCEAAAVGHFAEEHVEVRNAVAHAVDEITVGHCQLIEVGQHG